MAIATILREILKGLEYLHSEKKIHRDIKGIYVLIKYQGRIQIPRADFHFFYRRGEKILGGGCKSYAICHS